MSMDGELQEIRAQVSALNNPYPSVPIITSVGVLEGFYVERKQAEGQGKFPSVSSELRNLYSEAIKNTYGFGMKKKAGETS